MYCGQRRSMITINDFAKLDLRVARIVQVSDHPQATKLYILQVDIGENQIQLVAGLKGFYTPEELQGKLIIVVVNLEPKAVRGVTSCGMLLAAQSKETITILTPEKAIEPGSTIR